jgi:allantoinase
MKKLDLAIKSDKVFIDGRLIDCWIGVKDGIITAISKEKLDAEKIINAEGKMVLPGTVDPPLKAAQKMLLQVGLLP